MYKAHSRHVSWDGKRLKTDTVSSSNHQQTFIFWYTPLTLRRLKEPFKTQLS